MKRNDFWSMYLPIGLMLAVVTAFGVMAVRSNIQNEATADRATWGHGYCAALSGEWLNPDACNVDGTVVTIPKEAVK